MEDCLAVCLDLLGTCMFTDEVTHRQSIYLDDRSIPYALVQKPVITSFHTLVTPRRDETDSTFCPKIALGESQPLPYQQSREGRE